jgi:hypothetical protein
MDTMVKRRSRLRRQSTGKRIALTPRDIEIFKLLRRYRYLRSTFVHAFVGGDRTKLIERLGHLYHEGEYVNRPIQQWQLANAGYQPVVYELDAKGAETLALTGECTESATWLGKTGIQRQFAHALMICDTLASIELGVRESPTLRFVTWQEILDSPRCPEARRSSNRPFEFAVTAEGQSVRLIPDAVFGIEYCAEDRKTYRFFALEVDRGTMPVSRAHLRQSSYRKKLVAYREIIARELYRSQYGLPNFFVLTLTTGDAHLKTIMSTLSRLGTDTQFFLFKVASGLQAFGQPPPATSHMMQELWERVGYPPLALGIP